MDITGFCAKTSPILAIVGWALTIFKIAIPLIIIAIGIVDLGKAAVSSKPEEIKKSVGSLLWRIIGGIAIFFLPLLIITVFGWINGFKDAQSQVDWNICKTCIVSPGNEENCQRHVRANQNG